MTRRTLITLGLVAAAVAVWLVLVFQAEPGQGVRIDEVYAVLGPQADGACPPVGTPPPKEAQALEEGLVALVTNSPDSEVPHPQFPTVTLRAKSVLPLVTGNLRGCIADAPAVDPGWRTLLARLEAATPGG